MPHRVPLVAGAFGALVVILLVVLRADPRRRAGRGGRLGWLLAAGLAFLGLDGPVARGEETVETVETKTLRERVGAATAEAEEIVANKRGAYPFDRAGKDKLLAELRQAVTDVGKLGELGAIDGAEASLWQQDLRDLAQKVTAFRPKELEMATCYMPRMMRPAQESLARLEVRLPALKKLAAVEKLHPDVVARVLKQIELDLKVLTVGEGLSGDKRAAAERIKAEIQAGLGAVRARLPAPGAVGPWDTVRAFFKAAAPLAESGSSTGAERQAVELKRAAAVEALDELEGAGRVAATEAALLKVEIDAMNAAMLREPPSDSSVRCYRRAYNPPAKRSLARVEKRLPLLEKLVAEGKLSGEVVTRVVPALERDVALLEDEEAVSRLRQDEARAAAAEAVKRARALLGKLKK